MYKLVFHINVGRVSACTGVCEDGSSSECRVRFVLGHSDRRSASTGVKVVQRNAIIRWGICLEFQKESVRYHNSNMYE